MRSMLRTLVALPTQALGRSVTVTLFQMTAP